MEKLPIAKRKGQICQNSESQNCICDKIVQAINGMISGREHHLLEIGARPFENLPDVVVKMREEESAMIRNLVAEFKNLKLMIEVFR